VQVGSEVPQCPDHRPQLPPGHTVFPLCLIQGPAIVGHHLLPVPVSLGQDSPHPHIASIRVHNEGLLDLRVASRGAAIRAPLSWVKTALHTLFQAKARPLPLGRCSRLAMAPGNSAAHRWWMVLATP